MYIQLSSNFDSCPKRLCEGIGQTLRKDDSCNSTLAIYIKLFFYTALVHTKAVETLTNFTKSKPYVQIVEPLNQKTQ